MNKAYSGFFCGALFSVRMKCMHQDILGLEKYIQMVRLGWVNVHWAFWLVPMFLIVCIVVQKSKEESDAE